MGKFAILRVGFSYPFLPTLSSYPYRNNFFGRPRRRGRLWHVTATVIGSVSVQELNGRPLTEYRNGHNQADCRGTGLVENALVGEEREDVYADRRCRLDGYPSERDRDNTAHGSLVVRAFPSLGT
ncbi:hypothetical protein J6590_105508, partial [Homalodisca vitripennis]